MDQTIVKINICENHSELGAPKTNEKLISLLLDNWDDYSHKVSFTVYVFDEQGEYKIQPGYTKLLIKDEYGGFLQGKEIVKKFKNKFCEPVTLEEFGKKMMIYASSNDDLRFYTREYWEKSFGDKSVFKRYLEAVNDHLYNPRSLEESKRVVNQVLYRNDSIKFLSRVSKEIKEVQSDLDFLEFEKPLDGDVLKKDSLNAIEKKIQEQSYVGKLFTKRILKGERTLWKSEHDRMVSILITAMGNYNEPKELVEDLSERLSKLKIREVNNLLKITESTNNIRKILSINKNDDLPQLGHYTRMETLQYLVGSKAKLRLTNGQQLNDPNEGKKLLEILQLKVPYIRVSNTYIASATRSMDSLPMWKMYGDDGRGLFLKYDNEFIENNANKIFSVCYIDENEKAYVNDEENTKIMKEILNIKKCINDKEYTDNEQTFILNQIDKIRFLFKDKSYEYEKEYRIIQTEDLNDNNPWLETEVRREKDRCRYLLFCYLHEKGTTLGQVIDNTGEHKKYIEPKYAELVIGPKAKQELDYIYPYLKYQNSNSDIEINISNVDYR